MKTYSILAITFLSSAIATADPIATNSMGRPGGTASTGTLGSGTTASSPADRQADMYQQIRAQGQHQQPAYDDSRDKQSPANATVHAGVDRTTTTATTGMPIPFASVDSNDNGFVDRTEGRFLSNTGHDFKAADSDGDGLLSASEYQRMAGSRTP